MAGYLATLFRMRENTDTPDSLAAVSMEAIYAELHRRRGQALSILKELDAMESRLSDLSTGIKPKTPSRLAIDKIVEVVCECYAIAKGDLVSESRRQELVLPRQVCMCLIRRVNQCHLTPIAQYFARDHSTVIHAIQTVEEREKQAPGFRLYVQRIEEILREMSRRQSLPQAAPASIDIKIPKRRGRPRKAVVAPAVDTEAAPVVAVAVPADAHLQNGSMSLA
jgi:hypothetical protein